MKRCFLTICATICLFILSTRSRAQSNQTVTNGGTTAPVTFPAGGCTFHWTNSDPSIGLPASGTGSIPSFKAINNGISTVTATISAAPQLAGNIYIANMYSGSVSAIDMPSNRIAGSIPVGAQPDAGATSPDGSKVYISNLLSSSVSVISTATNTVDATVTVGAYPHGLVVSPDGARVYVANATDNTVSVINTATNKVIATMSAPGGPQSVVTSPDGSLIYVPCFLTGEVLVFNTSTYVLLNSIPVTAGIISIAISADGKQLYVPGFTSNTVSIINTISSLVTNTITVDDNPDNIAVSPDGLVLYVTSQRLSTLSVIDIATNTVTKVIPVGANPSGVAVSPDGSTIYVANNSSSNVSVIAASTNTVTSTITVGVGPMIWGNPVANTSGCYSKPLKYTISVKNSATALLPPNITYQTPQVYTTNQTIPPLSPKNTGGAVPATIYGQVTTFAGGRAPVTLDGTGTNAAFNLPSGIVADAVGNLYVTDFGSGAIRKVTPAAVVTTFNSVRNPSEITLDASGNFYVTDFWDNYIYKFSGAATPTIFAGTGATGSTNGPGANASFNSPGGIAIDASGNLYIADQQNNMIRKITPAGVVSTFAGAGPPGANNGPAAGATFYNPDGVAVDKNGNVFVADTKNNLIRKITPAGVVSTFAGSGAPNSADGTGTAASFNYPTSVAFDPAGNLYVTDYKSNEIRKITPGGVVTTLAGNGTAGHIDAVGTAASFNAPLDMTTDPTGNYLYVTDEINYVIRRIVLTGYIIDKPLPAGLTFDPTTGIISGTPTATSPPTNYTITAYNGGGSSSTVVNITVTSVPVVITAGPVTGTISACVGSASASPNIKQFTVSGSNLLDVITVTAPPGFQVSFSANGTYGSSVSLAEANGTTNSTTLYLRSAATDPAGLISGNVVLSSPGATDQNIAVTGVVNPLPAVNPIPNQTVNAGASTTAVNFTGTGNGFSWTNNTPSIGLPANGTGNIAPFAAVNSGTTPVTATVTVTPLSLNAAYIPDGSSSVSVINLQTNQVVKTIPAGSSPISVTISPDGAKVYVTNQGSYNITVISTATNGVIATIPESSGAEPSGVAVSPDGSKLYVVNYNSYSTSGLYIYNTTTYALIKNIPIGNFPYGVVVSHNGSRAYVISGDGVTIINTATNAIITTVAIGAAGDILAISPDDSKVYAANTHDGTVSVINTFTNTVSATISVGQGPSGIVVSPDGSRVYVANSNDNTISIIDAATNKVINTIPAGSLPAGMSVSPDGNTLYVVDSTSGLVSIINTSTSQIIATIPITKGSESFGNFILGGSGCTGTPTTFTITVNPAPPTIVASAPTGSISACLGSPSSNPNIEQLTVSGSHLTGNITSTAPTGFEVSTSATSGFGSSVTITETGGTANNTTVYVRSSASATGNISGNIVLSSPGAADQNMAVTGTINALPTVNPPANQTIASGSSTTAINFSGTATSFTWTIDAPGIGLPASGTGDIAPFTAVNTTGAPVTATITVTPLNSTTGCSGAPVSFTITVTPPPPPSYTASANLTGLTTTYGTPSPSESFTITGSNVLGGVLVTPPPGFEVSTDNSNFGPTATVIVGTAGAAVSAKVYIRLEATTPAGTYSGNIVLSTAGASDIDVAMPLSTVNKAPLVITADNQTKPLGAPNPALTISYSGFVNGENQEQLTTLPVATTTATTTSASGTYVISVDGAASPNYTFTYVSGTLTILPSLQSVTIPNAFTPNGDGINDVWNIPQLIDFPSCLVSIYSRYGSLVFQSKGYGQPWDGTSKGSPVPMGTYYYIIDPRQDNIKPLSGYVAVIR